MLYIGDAKHKRFVLANTRKILRVFFKREKMHSDAIHEAVVDSLLSSKAFDILPRPAFRGHACQSAMQT
jgi:hypothetical protein